MDTKGARHLKARLAVGGAVGERVEVLFVAPGALVDVALGETGSVTAIEEGVAHVLLDSGAELVVDPAEVKLRPCA